MSQDRRQRVAALAFASDFLSVNGATSAPRSSPTRSHFWTVPVAETPIAPDLAAIRERLEKGPKYVLRPERRGTCDGCAEEERLTMMEVASEAYLCRECYEAATSDAWDIIALLGYVTDLAAANERLRTVINEAVAFMDRRHHYADTPMIASLRAVLRGEVRRLDQGEPSALPAPNYLGRGA